MARLWSSVTGVCLVCAVYASGDVPAPQGQEAVDQQQGEPNVGEVHALPSAGWLEFQSVVDSVGRTERGTLNLGQVRQALQGLSERLGDEVGPVERWIQEQLLPQASATKDEMQNEVRDAAKKVEDCSGLMWSLEKEVKHHEEVLLKDESGEAECLSEEHRLHKAEIDTCQELMTFQMNLKSPTNVNRVGRTPPPMKEAINMNFEFYKVAYPEFMRLKALCSDAKSAAEGQHKECVADEEVIEKYYCDLINSRKQSCEAYDACYANEIDAMAKKLAKVKEFEAHVKEQFKSMACFGHAFNEDNDEEQECDPEAYTTNHLDVEYPETPEKQKCIKLMKTRRNFSDVMCRVNASELVNSSLISTNASAPEMALPA